MPRKEHIEPATTARDDEHHDGSGIVTRAQAAAAASSDRLVGGTTVPVFDLRDGADPSPCHKRSPIVFLYNHYWHRRRTAMERPRRPRALPPGSPFCSAASARSGSFAKCTASFDGSASDPDVLETFLDAIEVYKECLNINDEHALRGLPILLTGNAAVWFRARRYIHYASSRAFAKLPYELSEITKIDIVYGLFDRRIRKRVPRELIHSLDVLVNKSRLVEESLAEAVTTKAGAADRVSAPGRLPGTGRVEWPARRHSFIAQRRRPRGRVLRSQHESRRFVARRPAPRSRHE
ncbi:Activity-regulated cytoskeleton associated protein 1 [Eumeta japonica]|uniref:Activity-regulated cytoskeleton associated protein 1 n=1 Tax=Eumeta variegata TaxID=151549 RepID=A0A4C1UQM7_EUMVA|nr:Activity-regulated cytoskeleton associated protein 1 [Eumeta japonica]